MTMSEAPQDIEALRRERDEALAEATSFSVTIYEMDIDIKNLTIERDEARSGWEDAAARVRELEAELEAGKIQWAAVKANADRACEENAKLRAALLWIATVNACDHEYSSVAKKALREADLPGGETVTGVEKS